MDQAAAKARGNDPCRLQAAMVAIGVCVCLCVRIARHINGVVVWWRCAVLMTMKTARWRGAL